METVHRDQAVWPAQHTRQVARQDYKLTSEPELPRVNNIASH